jgi:hypothetical protein
VVLGVRFSSSVAGNIIGLRFYKYANNTGTHTGALWTSTGTQLGSTLTFTDETTSGWQRTDFASPIAIAANTTYVASVLMPNGNYGFTTQYFASPYINAPLQATLGVFVYGSQVAFPDSSWNNGNYWIDVVFVAT